jgi:general secretion pathway protein K
VEPTVKGRQRGVALLVVLWACTLLAIVVGGFASISRTEALQTRFSLGQQRARYAAEAGIMQSIAVIHARRQKAVADVPQLPGDLPGDGRSVSFEFDGMRVAVSILDETGKVDLNTADKPVLEGLFRSAGVEARRAADLADNIVEWRTIAGATKDEAARRYAEAGLSYGPRHVPFDSVEELQAVLGMDTPTYAAVAPAITIWSGASQPQAGFAPDLALAALPGMDLPRARALIELRDSVPPGTPVPGVPAGITMDNPKPGNTFTFRAVADDGHGAKAQVEATVRFSRPGSVRDRRIPIYTILHWRDGVSG